MRPLAKQASSLIRAATLFLFGGLLVGPSLAAEQGNVDPELRQLLQQAINENDSFEDRFEAEVWLVDMSQRLKARVPDPQRRLSLLKQIHFEAKRAGLWPELVLAVIEVESNFDRFAISSAGAMGLMQVMPFWLDEIGQPGDNLFDIRTNLRMGCTILKYYLEKENGNLTPALARYNGSYGSHRYTTKIYTALDNRWRRY
ncbi:lytic transglycosylase domain-containing protein [Thiohalophilus sp.]|uniref:lytic transglycosylase domain-containing protein n=1 Tax=Thiohalophilus sp. TaxID=3028392 RepID=UPI002ACD626C|nr:lytic transglycosylase domain-containing protein [Thiohalophilus sp.]MDZ7802896.1 lytic transglycosylase domain-containing protein [Thiohalophilus sp.]